MQRIWARMQALKRQAVGLFRLILLIKHARTLQKRLINPLGDAGDHQKTLALAAAISALYRLKSMQKLHDSLTPCTNRKRGPRSVVSPQTQCSPSRAASIGKR